MELLRKPFQGLWNIVRFNWHFYLLSGVLVLIIFFGSRLLFPPYRIWGIVVCGIILLTSFISLFVSWLVYDVSGLYKLQWLHDMGAGEKSNIANIHAGFDETSTLLNQQYPGAQLLVFDFYDPAVHTELSIARARSAYPPFTGTQHIKTSAMPVPDNYFSQVFIILAAHEIRNREERTVFFKEIKRTLQEEGRVIVTEHLRDIPNFMAYNIGFFHFLSRQSWLATFQLAGLVVEKEKKITPFISTFILAKNGTAH